jgi:hypothetical protein
MGSFGLAVWVGREEKREAAAEENEGIKIIAGAAAPLGQKVRISSEQQGLLLGGLHRSVVRSPLS